MWDLFVEGSAAFLGWWTYLDPIGPSLDFERGSFPLLYPLLPFAFYGVLATWVVDQRDDTGRFRHDVMLGVHRVRKGARRDLAQIASWVVVMNALYWIPFIFEMNPTQTRLHDLFGLQPHTPKR